MNWFATNVLMIITSLICLIGYFENTVKKNSLEVVNFLLICCSWKSTRRNLCLFLKVLFLVLQAAAETLLLSSFGCSQIAGVYHSVTHRGAAVQGNVLSEQEPSGQTRGCLAFPARFSTHMLTQMEYICEILHKSMKENQRTL